MKPVSRKLGEELVKKNSPDFVDMVEAAIKNHNNFIGLHPDKFNTPELLYAAVYYAIDRDVILAFYDHHGLHPKERSFKPKGEK